MLCSYGNILYSQKNNKSMETIWKMNSKIQIKISKVLGVRLFYILLSLPIYFILSAKNNISRRHYEFHCKYTCIFIYRTDTNLSGFKSICKWPPFPCKILNHVQDLRNKLLEVYICYVYIWVRLNYLHINEGKKNCGYA